VIGCVPLINVEDTLWAVVDFIKHISMSVVLEPMEKYLKERCHPKVSLLPLSFCCFAFSVYGQSEAPFTSTPLKEKGDLSSLMVEGIDRFLMREIDRTAETRANLWQRDFSTPEALTSQ
jgi:hypothetical protein